MADIALAGSGQGTANGAGTLSRTTDVAGVGQGQASGTGVLVRDTAVGGAGTGQSSGAGTLARLRSFAGTGQGQASGTGVLVRDTAVGGAGTGQSSGAGALARLRSFAGTGQGVASGTGALQLILSFAGTGQGVASGSGAIVRVRRLSGDAVGRASGAGQVHTFFSGSGVGTATGAGLFSAASTQVKPVPSQTLMEPEDFRLFPQVADTGTLNVTFQALQVNGNAVNSQPSWVEFDYFTRRINANLIDVVPYARVDISRALFLQSPAANSLIWEATVDNGTSSSTSEFELRILDERVPTERTVLVFWDYDNHNVVKRSELVDSGVQTLFSANHNQDFVNALRYDQLNRKFLIVEYEGNFDYGLRSRDPDGSFNGRFGSQDSGFAAGKDEVRGWILKQESGAQRLAYYDYNTNRRRYLASNVGNQSSNINDIAVEEDYYELFVVGRDLLGENAGIVKTEYRETMFSQSTVPSSETGRVHIAEVDHFNRVLVTVEQDHRTLVVRNASDLSKQAEHDFGNTQSFWGLSLDAANRRIFFSRDNMDGIQSTPYGLDGTFRTEQSGSYRWPVVLVDSKRGLPANVSVQETRVDNLGGSVEVDVAVLDVSGFDEYRLLEAGASGGNFISIANTGRSAGESVTLAHTGLADQTTHFYKVRCVRADGQTEDETAKRFAYPFEDSATAGLVQDAEWTDPSVDYMDLSPAAIASARCVLGLEAGDNGIIMEAGAGGDGMALFTDGSTLYFACGDGAGTSSDSRTAWIEAPMPTGTRVVVEWSASADTDGAALYVNGSLVGTDTFTEGNISGGNEGGISGSHGGLRAVPSSVDETGFGGDILSCRVFVGETTSDV